MIEKLVLGTVQLGLPYGINNTSGKPSLDAAKSLLSTAFNAGIRCVDTAEAYGDSQRVIGAYHRENANKFCVITKYNGGQAFSTAAGFRNHFLHNLPLLGVSSLEAYLFHNYNVYQDFDHWEALEHLVAEGYIKHLGVSVYTNEQAEDVSFDDRIKVVQLPFNLLDNFSLRGDTLTRLRERRKEVHIRSVFLQGLFYKSREQLGKLFPLRKHLEQLDGLAAEQQLPIGALALGYCLQQPLIDKVLIGVETEAQLLENIALARQAKSMDGGLFQVIDDIAVSTPELLNPTNWS